MKTDYISRQIWSNSTQIYCATTGGFLGCSEPSERLHSTPPPALRPGRRGCLLLPPRRPALARAQSRSEGGRTQVGLNVVHRHRLRNAADIHNEILGAWRPDLVWTVVEQRKAGDRAGNGRRRTWRFSALLVVEVAQLSSRTCWLCMGRMTTAGAQKTTAVARRRSGTGLVGTVGNRIPALPPKYWNPPEGRHEAPVTPKEGGRANLRPPAAPEEIP